MEIAARQLEIVHMVSGKLLCYLPGRDFCEPSNGRYSSTELLVSHGDDGKGYMWPRSQYDSAKFPSGTPGPTIEGFRPQEAHKVA